MKISFSVALACLFFFAIAPQLQAQKTTTPAAATAVSAPRAAAVEREASVATEKTITVKVTGVGCYSDVRTIAGNVQKMAGVNSCEVIKKAAVTRFEVSYNPTMVTEEAIYKTVEDTPGCKNPASRPYEVKL